MSPELAPRIEALRASYFVDAQGAVVCAKTGVAVGSTVGSMFSPEWLKMRAAQLSLAADRIPCWLLDTRMTCERWMATDPRLIDWNTGTDAGPDSPARWPVVEQTRALALAWWLMDYGLAEALNPALEQARTILGVPL